MKISMHICREISSCFLGLLNLIILISQNPKKIVMKALQESVKTLLN